MRFDGKTALVTGAASGFGHAAALLFGREGARVAALDLTAAESLGPGSISLICDVGDEAAIEAAVSQAVETLGPIDAVFNNAGIAVRQPVDQQDADGRDDILGLNCLRCLLIRSLRDLNGRTLFSICS